MAGHSHWAGIKRQKEVADKKRGAAFSKLLSAIVAAARTEPNPDFNPRLRTFIEKARAAKVPNENIERALGRAREGGENFEELVFEAYGPGGVALIIDAVTDSRNRAVAEIKKILGDYGGKWAEPGSVRWAFEASAADGEGHWRALYPLVLRPEDHAALRSLVAALKEHDSVQGVVTNDAEPL